MGLISNCQTSTYKVGCIQPSWSATANCVSTKFVSSSIWCFAGNRGEGRRAPDARALDEIGPMLEWLAEAVGPRGNKMRLMKRLT